MKTFFNCLLLMVIIVPCRAQKVKPALNLVKGDTYYSNNTVTSNITQTFNGQQSNVSIDLGAKTAYKVLDVLDTVYNLQVSYAGIHMKIVSPGSTMDMNSESTDKQDIASTILAGMVNKPFTVTLSKTGRVISVKNIENIMNAIFSSVPQVDSTQKEQLKMQFMQSFGEKAFKGNMEQALAIYPSVKVSKDDKWVVNTLLSSVMEANIATTYQLTGITDTYYQIHGDAKMSTLFNNKTTQVNGMPVKYDMTGGLTSDIKIDKKTGWVIQENLKQDISGNFEILDNPQVPGGMKIPMSIHSTIITTN